MIGRSVAVALLMLFLSASAFAADEPPLSPEAETLFYMAFTALKADKPAEALPIYERALELAPDSWRIWCEYTICLRLLNRQPAAARAGWRAVDLVPAKESGGWVNLGNVLTQAWRFDAAAAAYEEALEADGDREKASRRLTTLGYEAERAGQPNLGLKCYERAIALDRKNAVAHTDKCRVLHCMGGERAKESDACFEKAKKLALKQGDNEALIYATDLLLDVTSGKGCALPPATLSHQPLPDALLTRPQEDPRKIALPATVERRWLMPGGKTASFQTPEGWEETEADEGLRQMNRLSTIQFEPPGSLRWRLLLSHINAAAVREDSEEQTRRLVEEAMHLAKQKAADVEATLVELKGGKVSGWYFTITDKSMVGKPARPGQWPHMTQGVLDAGGSTWFSFTLLSHTREPADLKPVLEALATLKME